MLRILGLIFLSSALAGCASSEKGSDVRVVTNTPQKLAIEEIRDIAVEARDELRILAKYQQALASESLSDEQHRQKFFQSVYVPPGFEQEVDFNVQGRARDVAKAIATISGYDLDVIENNTSIKDPMVNINIRNQPLNEALKELGMQTGGLIDVEVYSASKLMVLRYANE